MPRSRPERWHCELRRFIEPGQHELLQAWRQLLRRFLFADNTLERYAYYLVHTYHYVKYSVPLMALACMRLGGRYSPLIPKLAHHIVEEYGHDQWVLNDLETLGYRRDVVRRATPLSEVVSMIGTQFFIINEMHPIGLLGYIYALESKPATVGYLRRLSKSCRIPLRAMSALIGHAKLDPKHIRFLDDILDSSVIDPIARRVIKLNAKLTLDNAVAFLQAVGAPHTSLGLPAPATHTSRQRTASRGGHPRRGI